MSHLQAIILAIVEGLTEFLPVSSTGHIMIASYLMKIGEDPFTKAFTVIIQFGAILSVLVLYRQRFLSASIPFYKKLIFGFLPAAVIGVLVKNKIDALLGNIEIVAYSLIVGGVVLLFVDRYFKAKPTTATLDTLENKSAVKIGFYQCLAFIPGVSRSAASIIGGQLQGLDRTAAAEYSFFLAVPTLAGATFLKMLKLAHDIDSSQWLLLAIGNMVAFIVAYFAMKMFVQFLSKHGFFVFGVYRILAGLILLLLIHSAQSA
jgi:undecaprenyl-diphosphatase